MKRAKVAIIATPAIGNLVPAVEFATHLINHHHRCISVAILVISMPQRPLIDDYVISRTSTQHIRFIQIHTVDPPPPDQYHSTIEFISLHIENHKPNIKQTLKNLMDVDAVPDSVPVPLVGLFIDMFCTSMIDVANDLGIPSYLFFTSPAAYLGFVLHLTTFPATESISLATELTVPSYANPVPPNVLPSFCIKRKESGYSTFIHHALRYKETKGIVVNTFQELEPYALDSLSSSKYFGLPPVYPVGPIIDHFGPAKWHPNRSGQEKIIGWLDRQPSGSVVFLCLGSMGSLSRTQVREIATGLERTGYRFLWTLREPAKAKLELPNDYKEFDENLFPDGFIDRTAETGLVCGWAPQVSVLAHEAIGGFVSHCGWNSILESLWYGVPIATWPLYAEQQLNAFEMVKEIGLSVELRLDSRDKSSDLVLAEEVERGVRELMDGRDGELRRKVKEMSEKSKNALMENGSSFGSLGNLIDILFSNV
ncbi:UDP-glycosyltransferase 43-like [Cynara cardunculus var. scolymus]|uniref:Glycosyltransferase n=1 Tax=Cynara cardunculus var. scolymus TaxID=59895 RepID=A0A124SH49_CYNCS|nr:UDP-glycosyltransferase 43-like [Cynara cardunculus var. scolymus]KVI08433.1 UDP-glucuronosyl/UDP-glucosyltransferase [Cynara cardunculus var. scolymus]